MGSLPERYGPDTRVVIGLRGALFYGGIIEGRLGDENPVKTIGAAVDDATLVAYFPQAVEPAAVEAVPAAVAPAPAEGPQPPPTHR